MWVSNQCRILKIIGQTKVKQMLCFDNSRIQGKINPCGFSCCTFQGDGSVVVDSLFLIAPDVCGFLCLVPVFVMQYIMSFLVFFTLEERAGCFTLIVFLLSCSGTCKYVMCLPSQCPGLVYGLCMWHFLSFLALHPLSCFFVLSVMVIPMYFID